MKTVVSVLTVLVMGLAALDAQVVAGNRTLDNAVSCPASGPVAVVVRQLPSAGTWIVHGTANTEYTNANPGHNLGTAMVADVTTQTTIRHDGFSSATGTVFSSQYGYQTGSPQRVITVNGPTLVFLLVHAVSDSGNVRAWGSIVATKQ